MTHDGGFGGIKNHDLFMQAQMKPKQTDWFSRMNQTKTSLGSDNGFKPRPQKIGLTKEDEIQLGLDMIPVYKAREEELVVK
jgi:hypothetical protein